MVDLQDLWSVFNQGQPLGFDPAAFASDLSDFPVTMARETPFLTHPVFNKYHTETEMLRYLRRLEAKDSLAHHEHDPAGLLYHEAQRHHGNVHP